MYCVIVGDIIGSTEFSKEKREKVLDTAKSLFAEINFEYMNGILAEFGMVRGDAFEGVLSVLFYTPEIIQKIIKGFYLVDKTSLRIAIAVGDLSTISKNRNETDGPAFQQAFKDLDILKKRNSTHWLQVSFTIESASQPILKGMLNLLSSLTVGWTEKQRETAWEYEARSKEVSLVSKALGVTKAVVYKQLKAMHYEDYMNAWEYLKDYLVLEEASTRNNVLDFSSKLYTYYSLALYNYNQNEYKESELVLQNAIISFKKIYGRENEKLAATYNLLANTYIKLNNLGEATKCINRSLTLQKKLPKARAEYIMTMKIKADINALKRKFPEAIDIYDEIMDLAGNFYEGSNPLVVYLTINYANLLVKSGDYTNALEHLLNIKGSSNNPIQYATIKKDIAVCYSKLSNKTKSFSLLNEAIDELLDWVPANHPLILEIQNQVLSLL